MRQPCSAGSKNWGPNHLQSESDQLAIRLDFILPGYVIFVRKGRIMYPTASMLPTCLKEEFDIRGAPLTYVFKGVPRCACGPLMSMSCFPEHFAFPQEPAIRQGCLHEGGAPQALSVPCLEVHGVVHCLWGRLWGWGHIHHLVWCCLPFTAPARGMAPSWAVRTGLQDFGKWTKWWSKAGKETRKLGNIGYGKWQLDWKKWGGTVLKLAMGRRYKELKELQISDRWDA